MGHTCHHTTTDFTTTFFAPLAYALYHFPLLHHPLRFTTLCSLLQRLPPQFFGSTVRGSTPRTPPSTVFLYHLPTGFCISTGRVLPLHTWFTTGSYALRQFFTVPVWTLFAFIVALCRSSSLRHARFILPTFYVPVHGSLFLHSYATCAFVVHFYFPPRLFWFIYLFSLRCWFVVTFCICGSWLVGWFVVPCWLVGWLVAFPFIWRTLVTCRLPG